MSDHCSICQGRGVITEPSPYSYRPGDTITRTCDCRPRDPEPPQSAVFGWRAYADQRLAQLRMKDAHVS